jgi:ubiquinone/menaquinone biosynthesis C-methylase UbiE
VQPAFSDPETPPQALSLGAIAEEYDRYRPAPPRAALDWLLQNRVGVALDVGAGTGARTRLLQKRAQHVIAVEPDPRMRAVIARRLPQARLLEGRAEALPLPNASVDAVLISDAWHWMDPQRAVPEIARVLRSAGVNKAKRDASLQLPGTAVGGPWLDRFPDGQRT